MVAFCAFIAGFIGIELFSIFFHKYVLHGPLWFIHKTHHKPQAKGLEWNDLVSLSFAIVAIVLKKKENR